MQHADKMANMITRLEHVSHLGPPWLRCIPLISISLMQLGVGHCYIHYKILHGDSDSTIQAQRYEFMVESSIDRVLDNAMREMQSVRKADLQECGDENIEHTELPRSVLHIIDLTKRVFLAMNETLPMTATISDTYRQDIRQGWSNGSSAVYRDRKLNADCTFNLCNESGRLYSDVKDTTLNTPLFVMVLQLSECCDNERSDLEKVTREHAISDLLTAGCCRSLLESIATEPHFSASAALKDTIKWYAYTPHDRSVPPQFRETQMQSRILAIWDASRVASSPTADELVKLQRDRTIPQFLASLNLAV